MKHLFYIFVTGLFLLTTKLNYAQQADSSTSIYDLTIEELLQLNVTTLTKTTSNVMDIPGVTTIITKNDIQRLGLRKLSDVLMIIPGIGHIQNDDEHIYAVRGIYATTNQKFLVLRDGHKINEFMFDRITGQYELSLCNIKKIEIVRGSGASLYGNAAVTAVINLISDDSDNCSISMGFGNYGQKNMDFVFSKNISDNEHVMAFVQYSSTDGEPVTRSSSEDYARSEFALTEEMKIDHFPNNYNFGFRYTKKAITFSTEASRSEYRLYWGTSGQNSNIDSLIKELSSESDDVRSNLTFSPILKSSKWQLTFQHHFNYSRVPQLTKMLANHLQYPPFGKILSFGWHGYSIDANYYGVYTYKKGDVLFGTVLEKRTCMESFFMSNWANPSVFEYSTTPLLPEGSELRGATYLQIQHRISNSFLLNGGIRYDYATDFDATFNPRLAVIYQPFQKIAAKLVYTQAFQAPSYFYRESNPNLGYSSTENLNAEIMKSWQGILRYNFTNLSFIELVYYYNDLNNLIRKDGTEYKNLGQITIQGIELSTNVSINKFSAFGNYSWVIPVTEKIDSIYMQQNVKDGKIKHLAEHTINAGVNYNFSDLLNINFHTRWCSAFYTQTFSNSNYKMDSNFTLNASILSKNLIKGIDISFTIFNLLNKKYKTGDPFAPFPLPQAGLWFLAKVTYNW